MASAIGEQGRPSRRNPFAKPDGLNLVRSRRLELPRPFGHNDLNVARLPGPPRPHVNCFRRAPEAFSANFLSWEAAACRVWRAAAPLETRLAVHASATAVLAALSAAMLAALPGLLLAALMLLIGLSLSALLLLAGLVLTALLGIALLLLPARILLLVRHWDVLHRLKAPHTLKANPGDVA